MSCDKNYGPISHEKLAELQKELERVMSARGNDGFDGSGVLPSFALDCAPFVKNDPIESHLHAQVERLKAENSEARAMINSLDAEIGRLTKEACTMCVSTKRGPARVKNAAVCGGYVQLLELEDGSGIGVSESDLWQSGYQQGMEMSALIMEVQSPHVFCDPDDLAGKIRSVAKAGRS